jgi:Tfp pilus assembly protein PilE
VRTGEGLTPIELMVVVAVITVLTATLMPAIQRVKEQRSMIECLANLRKWNPIISTYVEGNDGKFFSGHGTESSWWISQLEDRHQSRLKNNLWFCPKAAKPLYDKDHKRADTFSIFLAWGIYARDFNGPNDLSPDGVAGSYGLNGYVLSNETPTDQAPEENIGTDNFWKTPHVQGAGNIPLLVEALSLDVRPQAHQGPAAHETVAWGASQMGLCSINRHVGFENVSFCDFSARKVGLKELWTLKWHRTFDTAGPWTEAGGVEASNWPQWIRPLKDY